MLNRYWLFLGLIFPLHVFAETGKPNYVPPPSVISTESALHMMGGLLFVLAIIGGITWLLKRFALLPTAVTGTMKVIAATGVGQRERVVIVEIESTWLVLGVAPGRINRLHTMRKPALDSAGNSAAETFAEQFDKSINKSNVQ
jgi:flagellar protein FliO/FliZ